MLKTTNNLPMIKKKIKKIIILVFVVEKMEGK